MPPRLQPPRGRRIAAMDSKNKKRAIDDLEKDVEKLRELAGRGDVSPEEIERLRGDVHALRREFLDHIQPWQRTQLARHPNRPYTLDYIRILFEDFIEICGDRAFGDDPALIAGMARFHGRPCVVIGHQKGRDTKQRLARNFGQAKPEGYRKALRVMQLAAKFKRPIFTLVDTPGAYPGIDAEERGQAEAIARNLREMMRLPVPIIVSITGEGGSGGALAIAVGDRIQILENAIYSVISPEGCASIMWRDSSKAEMAAAALRITSTDLLSMGLVDAIVPEPEGGAHLDHQGAAALLDAALVKNLQELDLLDVGQLLERRYQKFRRMGQFYEDLPA
jgi:acetyl-CoA carboxylase carboxyl transferase subunit alpha